MASDAPVTRPGRRVYIPGPEPTAHAVERAADLHMTRSGLLAAWAAGRPLSQEVVEGICGRQPSRQAEPQHYRATPDHDGIMVVEGQRLITILRMSESQRRRLRDLLRPGVRVPVAASLPDVRALLRWCSTSAQDCPGALDYPVRTEAGGRVRLEVRSGVVVVVGEVGP